MKIQLKCDKCGAIGGPDEILTSLDGYDLCWTCIKLQEIEDLKSEHSTKAKWLEETHLAHLRSIEARIKELESQVVAATGHPEDKPPG